MQFKTKTSILFIFCVILFQVSFGQRIQTSINENWKFLKINASQFETDGLNDISWKLLNLPHTWNADDAFDDERGYYQGFGCYRKKWFVPASWKGKTVNLHFEGANHTAEVYCNGQLAAKHIGGYTAFRADVSKFLKFGAENLIAVRVSNANDPKVAPLSADFTFYGGIYRNVWAIVNEPAHFDLADMASEGIILSPKEDKKGWSLGVSGKVILPQNLKSKYKINATIFDPNHNIVGTKSMELKPKGKPETLFSFEIFLGSTVLKWSPDKPDLYSVKTELIENEEVKDEIQNHTAFYNFKMTADKGAFLNGEAIKLMGVCRHQDFAGLGNALPDDIHYRDAFKIKEMGGNFLRIAHYPQAKALLDACDKLGILVWEEIPIVNEITPDSSFFKTSIQQLKEMIAQHRNHPSVVMWGYMNEVFLGFGKQKTDSARALHTKETVRLAKILDSVSHKTDPARLSVMALHNSSKYNESGIADVANVTGWNLYHGWYHDAFPDFGTFMDKEHSNFPKRIHLISEFGAGSDQRLSSSKPNIYDFSPQWQLLYHQSYLKQIMDRPWISGGAMWNLVDFGSEGRKETMPHINNKGLLTMDRKPKDAYYLYQAFLSKKPMARLAIGDWNGKVIVENKQIQLSVISNQSKVFLKAENQKIGEVEIKDGMGIFQMAAPEKAIWITLETSGGQNLGNQELIPIQTPDIKAKSFSVLHVNLGSNCAYAQPETDCIWFISQEYKPGSWGHIGGQNYKSSRTRIGTQAYIDQTKDQPLYQTMQDSISAFKADVADGTYELEFLFAELEPNVKPTNVLYDISSNKNPNKTGINRVFNIRINGQLWKENFEPAKDLGPFRAGQFKVKVIANQSKGISIDFEKVKGNPMLNGLILRKL